MKIRNKMNLMISRRNIGILVMAFFLAFGTVWAQVVLPDEKPRVWVITDLRRITASGDPDDIVSMSVFLLMANHFDIAGITVGADIRSWGDCGDAAEWTNREMIENSYNEELENFNKHFGGYPENLTTLQSGWCNGTFDEGKTIDIENSKYASMKALIEAAKEGPLWISAWGEQTEFAYVAQYLLDNGMDDVLHNMKYVPHWTWPKEQSNCQRDRDGCDYVYDLAAQGKIEYYNIGPLGEYGIVRNDCNDGSDFPKNTIMDSKTGNWIRAKIVSNGTADFSDAASFLVLLGFGGGIDAYTNDAKYNSDMIDVMCEDRQPIFDLLERASLAAQGMGEFDPPFPEEVDVSPQFSVRDQDASAGTVTYNAGAMHLAVPDGKQARITIYNVHGKQAARQFTLYGPESQPVNLPEGLYLVKVETGGGMAWDNIAVVSGR